MSSPMRFGTLAYFVGVRIFTNRLGHNPRSDVHRLPEQIGIELDDSSEGIPMWTRSALRVGAVVLGHVRWIATAALTGRTLDW